MVRRIAESDVSCAMCWSCRGYRGKEPPSKKSTVRGRKRMAQGGEQAWLPGDEEGVSDPRIGLTAAGRLQRCGKIE